jgi:hypothetical protein
VFFEPHGVGCPLQLFSMKPRLGKPHVMHGTTWKCTQSSESTAIVNCAGFKSIDLDRDGVELEKVNRLMLSGEMCLVSELEAVVVVVAGEPRRPASRIPTSLTFKSQPRHCKAGAETLSAF